MFIVRNLMTVNLGRRSELVALLKEVFAEAKDELGLAPMRILTGSIGPSDQTIVIESEHETLASFEAEIEKMSTWPGMAKYGERWGAMVMAGSTRFEVFRVQ